VNLPKNHPVRYLLDTSAGGQRPSAAQMQILDRSDLPAAANLTGFTDWVADAADTIARLGATGNYGAARTLAEEAWTTISEHMSDEQRSLNTLHAQPLSSTDEEMPTW
jgi:hypothetical protein